MSLEDLMNIKVTSVSRRTETLSDAATAVFVITAEDIRRSGATSIPEALRMAPGVEVGRIDANKWAITVRGFNGRFANKLLVLVDGRSVYTPLFSGLYWDVQDVLLEDIDRIEVIRGPGGTLWGANAVNGVINIITKSAGDTQGGIVSAGYGTEERGFAGARYGSNLGENLAYRLYAKYFNRDDSVDGDGDDAADGWNATRAGFRADWRATDEDSVTFQGDIYTGDGGQTSQVPTLAPPFAQTLDNDTDFSGGNALARWRRQFSESSDLALQAYYDRTSRDEEALIEEDRDTFALDFQHQFGLGKRHEIIWGLGYRLTSDDSEDGPIGSLDPSGRTDNLFSAFL
jgi:iron complex outermembrane receptor protein